MEKSKEEWRKGEFRKLELIEDDNNSVIQEDNNEKFIENNLVDYGFQTDIPMVSTEAQAEEIRVTMKDKSSQTDIELMVEDQII